MHYISVESDFSSAHFLEKYDGKCKFMHGHNWGVKVTFSGDKLIDGMLIDFNEIKRELKLILEKFDHKLLNELDYFKSIDPTAENISKIIYNYFKGKFSNAEIYAVEIKEGKNTSAEYKV